MKCMVCSTENREGANYCKGCGGRLRSDTPIPPSETPLPSILPPRTADTGPEEAPSTSAPTWTRDSEPLTVVQGPDRPGKHEQSPAGRPPLGAPSAHTAFLPARNERIQRKSSPSRAVFGFLLTHTWNPSGDWVVLREGRNIVGTAENLEGSFPQDPTMSRIHFSVVFRDGGVWVRDLDSTNATTVGGNVVAGDSVQVTHGTVIQAGQTQFELLLAPSRTEGSGADNHSTSPDESSPEHTR